MVIDCARMEEYINLAIRYSGGFQINTPSANNFVIGEK
jgi:hypothetical protein